MISDFVFRYVLIGKKANGTATNVFTPISLNLKTQSKFYDDTSVRVTPPSVSQKSIDAYKNYVDLTVSGGLQLKNNDLDMYRIYASFK